MPCWYILNHDSQLLSDVNFVLRRPTVRKSVMLAARYLNKIYL